MVSMVNLVFVFLSGSAFLYLLFNIFKFFHKIWWKPITIQNLMASQGIKGPAYRFLHGNSKEILKMRADSLNTRMVGFSHDLFARIHPDVYSWLKLYGRNYVYWNGSKAQLMVTEAEMIKEIMNNKHGDYSKIEVEPLGRKLLGYGLVTAVGEKWVKSRKLANYAFHGESLKSMIPAMIASVETRLENWKELDGKEIEVPEELRPFTSEVISRTAFGSSFLEGKHIFEMLNSLASLMAQNTFKLKLPGISKIWNTSDNIESAKLEKGINDSVLKVIKKREEKISNGEIDTYGADFLGLLIKASHDADESKRMLMADIIDECKTFYIAAQETTNIALSWTMLLLAIHTDWQEEARKEVVNLFGTQNLNPDGIAKLKIMSMIINESLRLYPPVLDLPRKVQREVKLGDLTLPAGLVLHIPILKLHTDPEIWREDAHVFKPERFSEGVAKATNNNPTAFLPFGMGAQTCVGVNFAVTEAKIVLSMILQRYNFTLSPGYIHSPINELTIRPQHGIQVLLHKL